MTEIRGIRTWIARRSEADDRLYERYGRPLEAEHRGEFVAISDSGQVIRGADELEVATKAIEQFGPGNFALRRIGAAEESRWRRPGP
jgi:hypothetical protein